MDDIKRLDFTGGDPSLSWDNPNLKWTAEPTVVWGEENPASEDGTPPLHPQAISFTINGGSE